ncbi:hypothetical protein Tco_0332279 [Tanacetum coccineum]
MGSNRKRPLPLASVNKVESEPPNGSNADITNKCETNKALMSVQQFKPRSSMLMMSDHNSSDLAPQRQMVSAENNTSGPAPFLNVQMTFEHSSSSLGHQCQMTSVHISSGLVLHQMMSDHNSSDLAPQRQEMSVENVSSGLVPQRTKGVRL